MTNRKTTKKALIFSALSLLLCFSMLVGTTFAWFTDSVTSANNIIQSGTLEVALEWANGTEALDTANWADASNTKIFNNTLWEPGYTEARHLKISNNGTLALKYELAIIPNGEVSALADVIDVYYIDNGAQVADRTALSDNNKIGTLRDLINGGICAGSLEAEDEKIVTLVLKMQESAGNEYQDLSIGTDFAIQLLATQMTYEEDSFDDQYDKDAIIVDKAYTADENASLKDVLDDINAAEDETVLIQLDSDIEWETGAGHGSTPWINENAAVKTLIVDGNGYAITAVGAGVGPIRMANGGTLIIKDAKIVDNSVSYAENSWELGYLEFDGNVEFYNCEVVNAIAVDGDYAAFENCTFNSNKDSEYGVWVSNGKAYFTGCTFTGPRGLKTHEAYGSEVAEIVVDNCAFGPLTKKPGVAIGTVNADTTIIIKNSTFAEVQAGDQGLYIYETDTDVSTFNFIEDNNTIASYTDVNSVADLKDALTNAGAAGAGNTFIRLNADMDLSNVAWTPIKVDGYHGADIVTIDGQGHTITGLSAPLFAGGFAGGSGIVIKDLTIADSNIVSTNTLGSGAFIESVDSMAKISLTNCHLKNSTVTGGDGSRTGGLIGWTAGYSNVNDGPVKTYVTISDCSVVGCTISSNGSVGGIYGHAGNNDWTYSTIEDCTVKDCVLNSTDDGGWRVGVVVGTANVGEVTINNITESGNTLTQTGKTAPDGQSNLYGRFVPGTTGKLTIDGTAIN